MSFPVVDKRCTNKYDKPKNYHRHNKYNKYNKNYNPYDKHNKYDNKYNKNYNKHNKYDNKHNNKYNKYGDKFTNEVSNVINKVQNKVSNVINKVTNKVSNFISKDVKINETSGENIKKKEDDRYGEKKNLRRKKIYDIFAPKEIDKNNFHINFNIFNEFALKIKKVVKKYIETRNKRFVWFVGKKVVKKYIKKRTKRFIFVVGKKVVKKYIYKRNKRFAGKKVAKKYINECNKRFVWFVGKKVAKKYINKRTKRFIFVVGKKKFVRSKLEYSKLLTNLKKTFKLYLKKKSNKDMEFYKFFQFLYSLVGSAKKLETADKFYGGAVKFISSFCHLGDVNMPTESSSVNPYIRVKEDFLLFQQSYIGLLYTSFLNAKETKNVENDINILIGFFNKLFF